MTTQATPILQQMSSLVKQWEDANDRRCIFLGCYALMTRNMLTAIDNRQFSDGEWISRLLHRFTEYYFDALTLYDQRSPATPPVWQLAHETTRRSHVMTLQHLLLGVNAHINYDLVFTLTDLLEPEWAALSEAMRQQRLSDHRLVNTVISETIDSVQDQIIEPRSPWFDLIDKVLGPVDEWITARLIARWREEVWKNAVRCLELHEPHAREEFRRQVEATALHQGEEILHGIL